MLSDQTKKTAFLPRPVRITDQVWPEGTRPLVAVWCTTYNHANFIRDAIEGFLMQETTFPVQILVHDDASTDRTACIIREYEKNYPKLFQSILQSENQYSKGLRPREFLDGLTRGKYIALCEGDDFWTCPSKLEKQVSLLEGDAGVALTFHKAWVKHQDGGEDFVLQPLTPRLAYDFDDILLSSYFIPTASMVFRRSMLPDLSELSFFRSGDILLQATLGHFGKILLLNEICSVYRKHDGGVSSNYNIKSHYIEHVRTNHFWGFYVLTRKLKGTTAYPALEAALQSIVKEIADYYCPELEGGAHMLRQKVEACLDRERPPSVSASDQNVLVAKLLEQYKAAQPAKPSATRPSIEPAKLLQETQQEIVETQANTSIYLMKHADELKNLLEEINPGKPRFPGVVPFLFLLNASRITRLLGEAIRELALADQRHDLADQNTASELKMALHLARLARFESKLAAIQLAEMQVRQGLSSDEDQKKPSPLHFNTLKHWLYVLESDQPHEHAFEYFRKLANFDVSFVDVGANTGMSALSIHKVAPKWPIVSVEMLQILEPMLRLTADHFKEINHSFRYIISGLGPDKAQINVTVPIVDGEYIHTMASMSPQQFTKPYIIEHLSKLSANGVWNNSVHTLPAVIKRFDDLHLMFDTEWVFAKIDAEGQEVAVLRGMAEFLANLRPGLLLETDDPRSVLAELAKHGYKNEPFYYDPTGKRLVAGTSAVSQGNYFFFPPNNPLFIDT